MAQIQNVVPAKQTSDRTVLLIAVFKLVKGVLLIAVGIGAFKLINRDLDDIVTQWVNVLRVDPDNALIHKLLARILSISPSQLKAIGLGTFFYAGLVLIEGTGLLLRKRWAEYFTIISTGCFVPLEIYELAKHLSVAKFLVLATNVAIVVYLIVRLRRENAQSASTT